MRKLDGDARLVAGEPEVSSGGVDAGSAGSAGGAGSRSSMDGRATIPNPEVDSRPMRRRFSAAYKVGVVEEAEGCTESGAIGALPYPKRLASRLTQWNCEIPPHPRVQLGDEGTVVGRKYPHGSVTL